MAVEGRHADARVLGLALAVSVPTLLGVWLLELGRRIVAFGWPWSETPPNLKVLGGFSVLLYGVVAGVLMTRRLLANHAVLTAPRRRLLTAAYVVLGLSVGTEIWSLFFDAARCPEMLPILFGGRLTALPLIAFLGFAYVSIYRSVDEKLTNERALSARLMRQSTTDDLTGLANRSFFLQTLNEKIEEAQRARTAVAVFFVDLDRFKWVNDMLGHEVGDQLLKQVGARLRGVLREDDLVGRIGGDEFVALATGLDLDGVEAGHLAERLVRALAQPTVVQTHELTCTASVGMSLFPTDARDVQELVRNADLAMYAAKERGRNLAMRFHPTMLSAADQKLQLEQELRQALHRGELSLEYQPLVDVRSAKILSLEALIRWDNPQRGRLGPDAFIPVAEDSGLIVEVDRWVIKTACAHLAQWRKQIKDLRVSINLSARSFSRDDFDSVIREELSKAHVPPEALDLEVTERVLLAHTEPTVELFRRLRELGVTLTLDDFGTGYSALGYLSRFPVDGLKIDRALIARAHSSNVDAAVTAALLALGQRLGLTVVAEGVETDEQLIWLRDLGCQVVQGFIFSKPVHVDAVAALLSTPQAGWNRLRLLRQVS